jgi:hypothetical protein
MIQTGVLQQPVSLLLTGTSVTDVHSIAAGDGVYTLSNWKIVNADSSDRLVSLWWHNGTDDYPIFRGTIGANSTMWDDNVNVQLNAKTAIKKIKAQAAAGNVVTITLIFTTSSQSNASLGSSGR